MKTMHTYTRRALYGLTAAGLLALSVPADAYRMLQNNSIGRVSAGSLVTCNNPGGFAHWNIRNIPWRYNPGNQGANAGNALSNATRSWTQVGGASHNLSVSGTTNAGFRTDGINTFLWARGNGCNGSCLAITALVLEQGQEIVESDISFNNRYNWNTNGSDFDIEAVAAHELGHTLGIHHTEVSSNPFPTMRATYFGTAGRSLENDDNAALQCSESRY